MAYAEFKPWMLNGHPGNVTWRIKEIIRRGVNHGLYTTSTTGGRHATGSYHYSGRAVDMAGTRANMVAFQRDEHARNRRYNNHMEIIGPDNEYIVLGGRETDLVEGTPLEQNHDTHVHIAQ